VETFDESDVGDIEDVETDVVTVRKSVSGRKKGSTVQAKKDSELNVLKAKTAAAERYYEAKQEALLNGKLSSKRTNSTDDHNSRRRILCSNWIY
jgi:hypothetical protein